MYKTILLSGMKSMYINRPDVMVKACERKHRELVIFLVQPMIITKCRCYDGRWVDNSDDSTAP